jgi:hypothetical protein
VRLATAIAGALIAAVDGAARLSLHERSLLNGAIGYFLEVEDEAHDVRDPRGFEDDARVARSVLEVIGRVDLAAEIEASLGEP